ncbi:Uncharacterised protein g5717 [Pycnogonum litorale]
MDIRKVVTMSSCSRCYNCYVVIIMIVTTVSFLVTSVHTIGKRHSSHERSVDAVHVQGYFPKRWDPQAAAYTMKSGIDNQKPYFDESTSRNVTTTTLKTAYLHCRVRNLGGRTVSWIRKKDLHILTIGTFAYTTDNRYSTMHMENSDDWTLEIQYPEKSDAGIYECQVSTVPKMSLKVQLNVVEANAEIIGGPSLYLKSGNSIRLTCLVKDSPVGPEYVFWHHNGKAIDYDSARGEVNVRTQKSTTTSILRIKNAKVSDSGNYSCNPSNASPATINVHVLNGEHPAAMQDGNHNSSIQSPRTGGGHRIHVAVLFIIQSLILIMVLR